MADKVITPKILSFEFHTQFFPRLLWSRLRPKKKEEEGVRFTHNMEFTVLLALCLIFAVIGVPLAFNKGSVVGWMMGIAGLAGILAILIFSILSRLGTRPSYHDFLIGTFFFFVSLAITTGIYIGTLEHSLPLGLLSGAAGLLLGYVLGIFAGLWFQYLGWVATIINMLSGLAIIGMITVDLVLLFGG